MGKITDIAPQKKRKDRVSVYIDGSYYCGLDALTATKNRLNIGDEISEERLSEIQRESEGAKAFDKALKYATYRMRTEKEVKSYMREKGYLPETVNEVMGKLREYGFIDDERFCKEYVAIYGARVGKKKIEMDLKRLGAKSSAIENALQSIDEQPEVAYATAQKYIRTHSKWTAIKLKQYLYSKGFSSSDINEATQRVCEEYDREGDDYEL